MIYRTLWTYWFFIDGPADALANCFHLMNVWFRDSIQSRKWSEIWLKKWIANIESECISFGLSCNGHAEGLVGPGRWWLFLSLVERLSLLYSFLFLGKNLWFSDIDRDSESSRTKETIPERRNPYWAVSRLLQWRNIRLKIRNSLKPIDNHLNIKCTSTCCSYTGSTRGLGSSRECCECCNQKWYTQNTVASSSPPPY
jgi:hypothetical protein